MTTETVDHLPEVVDLFAGPGGWDEGLRLLGLDAQNGSHELDPDTRPAHAVTTKVGSWTIPNPAGWGYTTKPAPTVCSGGGGKQSGAEWGSSAVREAMRRAQGTPEWAHKRPATTVVGSFDPHIIAGPGHREWAGKAHRQGAADSIRVSVVEAGILQSFRPDYPWQGTKTKRYEQVGNAVPPLLAAHVVAAATGRQVQR